MNLLQNIKDHFFNWRNWELNPIVVKEMRQAVRSWAVVGSLHLFLIVLLLTAAAMLLGSTLSLNPNQMLGRDMFYAFLGILTVGSLFVPVYIGVRLAAERQGENLDLIYITTLSPGRIIRGKAFCGMVISALFFSACLPFMFLTTFLRGIDLPTIFIIMLFVYLTINACVQVTIFIACLKISKGFKIVISVPIIGMGLGLLGPIMMMSTEMVNSGVGNLLGRWDFWGPVLTTIFSVGLALGLLHMVSIALVMPPSANRAIRLRGYITGLVFLLLTIFMTWIYYQSLPEMMIGWVSITLVIIALALTVTVSERSDPGVRVRRQIPSNPILRPLAFLFYSGAAGGVVWCCLLLSFTLAAASVWKTLGNSFGSMRTEYDEFLLVSTTCGLYLVAYALTGLLVRRKLFPRVNPIIGALTMILIPGLWLVVPQIVLFFTNKMNTFNLNSVQLGDIFNAMYTRSTTGKQSHLVFASVWAGIVLFANLLWIISSYRNFKPVEKNPAAENLTSSGSAANDFSDSDSIEDNS